jgi:FkbM family methyltransferase
MRIRPAQLSAFLKRLLHIRRQIIELPTGQRFLIDPVSVFGLSLIEKGIYELPMTSLIRGILQPGDTFIDIGGNEGYFSIIAAEHVGESSIICVEPQSRLVPVIEANAQLNNITSICIKQVALANTEGKTRIFLRPSTNNGASSFFPHWRLGRRFEYVEQKTFDNLLRDHNVERIRLVKCDYEGAEQLVVQGSWKSLNTQRIDFIALEFHPGICGSNSCTETDMLLRNAGYVLSKIRGLTIYHLPKLQDELRFLGSPVFANHWNE